jgi:polysaccharide biosynthesis protein PslG
MEGMLFRLPALFCLICLSAAAAELPQLVLPEGVGVNIHFVKGHEQDLNMIAQAGFKFVRMDFAWEAIERKKGQYDWSAYDELTANLEKRGLRAIYILDYSHALYEGKVDSHNALKTDVAQRDTASPQHPESIAAYARWAAAAAKHFHGRHIIWEIWNEPNGFFWKPRPDAEQYTTLALAAAKAIRAADSKATIIGPATSGFDWPFMESFLKSGVLEYLDAVSVHPYRNPGMPPESAAADYQKLRGLIEKYAPSGKRKMPIISGEWGYASNRKGVSLEIQAAFIARQQLANLLEGVPLSIWYDWKNDGTDPNENEHNFGTVTPELEPKPAHTSIFILTHELAGYRILRRMQPDDKDYLLVFVNSSGGCKMAVWTTGKPHSCSVEMPFKSAQSIGGLDGLGRSYTPGVEDGRLLLHLDHVPKYITLR